MIFPYILCLAGNELVPRLTKNTASGVKGFKLNLPWCVDNRKILVTLSLCFNCWIVVLWKIQWFTRWSEIFVWCKTVEFYKILTECWYEKCQKNLSNYDYANHAKGKKHLLKTKKLTCILLHFMIFHQAYSHSACLYDCVYNLAIDQCHCIPWEFPHPGEYACTPGVQTQKHSRAAVVVHDINKQFIVKY